MSKKPAKPVATIYDNKEIEKEPEVSTATKEINYVAGDEGKVPTEIVNPENVEIEKSNELGNSEVKDKQAGFLSESDRTAMIKSIEGIGATASGLTDIQLVKKLQDLAVGTNEKYVAITTDKLQVKLNGYAESAAEVGCLVRDKAFLRRLFDMNIPKKYLKLYRDQDANLKDRAIWDIARESGISPLDKKIGEILSGRK